MKIAILMEGETERVFLPCLRDFLRPRPLRKMPKLISNKYDGRIPKQEKLKRVVDALLRGADPDAHHVIALTDVYAGSNDFQNWATIQELARHNKTSPPGQPESVNHTHPPSYHLKEILRIGVGPRQYTKVRDAKRILQGKDLSVAAASCPELKAFLNTILTLCNGDPI